jgi:hypothetical protein
METITAYRFNDFYFFRSPVQGAEEVLLKLADGVTIREDELGVKRVFTDLARQGVGLTTAVAQGWCQLV